MVDKSMHCLLGCLFLFLLVGCNSAPKRVPAAKSISPICVLQNTDNYSIRQYIQVLADTVTGYSIEKITQPRLQNQFVAFGDTSFNSQSNVVYWGKMQVENRLPDADMHREWVLTLTETFTKTTLYRQLEDSTWITEVNGSSVPAREKNFVPTRAANYFKLALPPGKVVTLYFRGISEHSALPPSFQAALQPIDVFYDKLVEDKTWNTLFSGFLLMMLFYNLLNFFFARDSSYLYYTGYLLAVLVYTGYSADYLGDWIGHFVFVEHPVFFHLFKVSIFWGLMCYLAFIRSFLDLEHLLPKWDRYFRYLIWLGVPLTTVFFFLAFRYNFSYTIDDQPILVYIALVSLSCFVFIYPLSKTKDTKGFFIMAGIAVISLGFILTLYSRMTPPFTVFYLKVCTILEILIFSMGLAYRQRQQELAKQQADFALRESRLLQDKQQIEAERLQELNDFKSRFFTNITHEFRTPLTVMLGMSEQLVKEEPDEPKRNKLKLVQRGGENLLLLINQILDLAKLESNALKMNYIQGDVLSFTRYIAESLHSLANAQNLILRVESDQAKIVMDYDPERYLQIIHNLLSNAIKFTPSGGKVVLDVTRDLAGFKNLPSLSIQVRDSGAGIPPEELPHIFDRFFQAKNQEHAKAGGTGIGLSLTRELVRAMGGDISVESKVGVGTTFIVQLPLTNNSPVEDKVATIETHSVGETLSHADTTISPDTDVPTLLLIEDNPDVMEYLSACLNGQFQLDFAYNGQAGIEKALENVPDLIISDVMMPIKDGFEVVEALKNDERTSHIPIVLLTAKADVQSRLAGLRRGADAYLSKPFHQEELLVTVQNLLEQRRKLQLKYQQNIIVEAPVSVVAADMEDSFLQKIRAIIADNYADDGFGLPILCQKIGMSRSQLFRKMKALTDIAPSDLIRTHRLNKAKSLLESGTVNVAEAAWQVGFKDPSYFSKLYQEEFGEMPSGALK
jgi:signal transduction histidine kinase/DNA-binding NarL/FixJ family response regulator